MLTRQIGIIPKSDRFSAADLSAVAAAVSKQVQRDVAHPYNVSAQVSFFPSGLLPAGYWSCVIKDPTGSEDYAGYHSDQNGNPYLVVLTSHSLDATAQTVSHEVLETICDPFGSHMVAAKSIKPGQGRVLYLVEVGDPVEEGSYPVDGIHVSDFVLPPYYHTIAPGQRASYLGTIKVPHQIDPGGYLSWYDPHKGDWWIGERFQGGGIQFHNESLSDQKNACKGLGTPRERVDRFVYDLRRKYAGTQKS